MQAWRLLGFPGGRSTRGETKMACVRKQARIGRSWDRALGSFVIGCWAVMTIPQAVLFVAGGGGWALAFALVCPWMVFLTARELEIRSTFYGMR